MNDSPALLSLTFDCTNAQTLATFWAGVLGRKVSDGASDELASIETEPAWTFMAVPEPKKAKNRLHVDLGVRDLAAETERVLALGATKKDTFDEGGYRWVTFADPEGNEFDLVLSPS